MNTSTPSLADISLANRSLNRKVLLKGGIVLTMDGRLGDFVKADVLVEGTKIVAVGSELSADMSDASILTIDCTDKIVMPGFHDVHRHSWQGQMRRCAPDLNNVGEYVNLLHLKVANKYRPEDIYVGSLISQISSIDCGITYVHDVMHNPRSSEHADASIRAMLDSGIRGTYSECGIVSGTGDEGKQWPDDLVRVKSQYFSGSDQLLDLRISLSGAGMFSLEHIALTKERIEFARNLGIGVTCDAAIGKAVSDRIVELGREGYLSPDLLLVHCLDLSDEAWRTMADTEVGVGLTPTSDALLSISVSITPIQKVLDFDIYRAGISIDTETYLSPNLFAQIQSILVIQRMLSFNRRHYDAAVDVKGLTTKSVLEMATIRGAHASNVQHKTGSLTPGKEADLLIIDPLGANNLPLNNVYGTIAMGCDARNVEAVMIGGVFRKWAGSLTDFDLSKLRRDATASREYLYTSAGLALDIFEPLKPFEGEPVMAMWQGGASSG